MSFNRRGPDRRPDRPDRDRHDRHDRHDRPPQRRGDWQPRERGSGDRPFTPRDRPQTGGDRPYQPRGGDRPYTPRPRFDRAPDEGAMSIRLDPRRLTALKHLAGEAGVRPGDLVRQWVEERIDASRGGADAQAASPASGGFAARLDELAARIAALESASTPSTAPESTPSEEPAAGASAEAPSGEPGATPPQGRPRTSAAAAPRGPRVALHDEMSAVIRERGPLSAAELAQAINERGRYAPPRTDKPLDAAMVSQRVSNPTYRSRFTRSEGRIGLPEEEAQAPSRP
jgi:hypothetical protein